MNRDSYDFVQAARAAQGLPPLPPWDEYVAQEAAFTSMPDPNQAKAVALSALTAPLPAPTITGTTVATVKASADAAVKALAQEFSDRLAALPDALGG